MKQPIESLAEVQTSEIHVVDLVRMVKVAHAEWQYAQQRFHFVESPEEIDYAIFAWDEAERRYEQLLRILKKRM